MSFPQNVMCQSAICGCDITVFVFLARTPTMNEHNNTNLVFFAKLIICGLAVQKFSATGKVTFVAKASIISYSAIIII